MRTSSTRAAVAALALIAAVASTLGLSPAQAAAQITVNTTEDTEVAGDGKCSLREAINNVVVNNETTAGDCESGASQDLIVFHPALAGSQLDLKLTDSTTLGDTALSITSGVVEIDGSDASGLSISGGDQQRIFYVSLTGTLSLKDITLEQGQAKGDNSVLGNRGGSGGGAAGLGGAIFNDKGVVNIDSVTFVGNQAIGGTGRKPAANNCGSHPGAGTFGGAAGSPDFSSTGPAGNGGLGFLGGGGGGGGCSFGFQAGHGGDGGFGGGGGSGGGNNGGGGTVGNGGDGGIFGGDGDAGTATNGGESGSGAGVGGAIFNNLGTVNIENSTFTDNLAEGGAFSNAVLTNHGGAAGGAIMNYNGELYVQSSTFSENTVNDDSNASPDTGGAIYSLTQDGGPATGTINDTILANSLPAGTADFVAVNSTVTGASNIMENAVGWSGATPNSTDPQLGPLDHNGGPTQTLQPASTSPAVDAALTSLNVDQRGFSRPEGLAPDIGSVEVPHVNDVTLLGAPCGVYASQTATAPGLGGALTNGDVRSVKVSGTWTGQGESNGCAIPSDATAAIVKLEAVSPQGPGNLRISASAIAPTGGVVNYTNNGLNNSATITVPLSAAGEVDIVANIGTTHVRLVAIGYYDLLSTLIYNPLTPCAVADSRTTISSPPSGSFAGPFSAGDSYPNIDVVGLFSSAQGGGQTNCGVPSDAEAVVINVVSIASTGGTGGLAIGPAPSTPSESTTNFGPVILNNAASGVVAIGTSGEISLEILGFSGSPETHVRLVVLGYLHDATGQDYVPVNPCAAFDSRTNVPGDTNVATGSYAGKRTAGTSGVNLTGVTQYNLTGSIPAAQGGELSCGIPPGATAVLINLVAIQPDATGNFRAYATGSAPTGGVLNFAPLSPVMNNSNAVVVPISSGGSIDLFVNAPSNNGLPTVHARGVVFGYYL